jgi:putative DNA primase/helicase
VVAQSVAQAPAPAAVEPLLTTDQDNAALFIRRIAQNLLRYVPERGWLAWDGKRWEPDRAGKHWELAKLLSAAWLELANEADGAGFADRAKDYRMWSARCRQRNRLEAMLKMTETDPRQLALPEDLDRDGELLNTVSGTLHLPTDMLLPHLQEDLISKITGTYYDREAEAPEWGAFLARILPDPAVRDFVQRAVGYSLSGRVSEQCFFLLHGRGSNGKTTFLRALGAALGDYAVTTRPETFMARDGDAIPNDLAALAGARFVISSETNDGQRFDESRIKLFTGGDTITARFLHREYFTFTPSGKLWIACNHKPEIRGTDLGI